MNSFKLVSAIKYIGPNQLENYLRSSGWADDDIIDDKAKIWHRPEHKYFDLEIVQPLSQDLRDYTQRMYEAIQAVSDFEERSFDKVIDDVINFDSDIVKIRVVGEDVDGGAIPLDDGVLLF